MTVKKMVYILTKKQTQKVSSNGKIVIPKDWREKLAIDDTNMVEMELYDNKVIPIKKKLHPLEIEDNLFEGVFPFKEKEMEEAKKIIIFLRIIPSFDAK